MAYYLLPYIIFKSITVQCWWKIIKDLSGEGKNQ